jgi:hypothetical protein
MWPPCSANERSWRRAKVRARPSCGRCTPAHMPSAPGVFRASLAHRQRRGQLRHSALRVVSSPPSAQRSGSTRHGVAGAGVVGDALVTLARRLRGILLRLRRRIFRSATTSESRCSDASASRVIQRSDIACNGAGPLMSRNDNVVGRRYRRPQPGHHRPLIRRGPRGRGRCREAAGAVHDCVELTGAVLRQPRRIAQMRHEQAVRLAGVRQTRGLFAHEIAVSIDKGPRQPTHLLPSPNGRLCRRLQRRTCRGRPRRRREQ